MIVMIVFISQQSREVMLKLLRTKGKQRRRQKERKELNLKSNYIKKGLRSVYISPFEHNAVTRTLHYFEEKGDIVVNKF